MTNAQFYNRQTKEWGAPSLCGFQYPLVEAALEPLQSFQLHYVTTTEEPFVLRSAKSLCWKFFSPRFKWWELDHGRSTEDTQETYFLSPDKSGLAPLPRLLVTRTDGASPKVYASCFSFFFFSQRCLKRGVTDHMWGATHIPVRPCTKCPIHVGALPSQFLQTSSTDVVAVEEGGDGVSLHSATQGGHI